MIRTCKNPSCKKKFEAVKTYFNSKIIYPYCSYNCEKEANPQRQYLIPKVSAKRNEQNKTYMELRKDFLKGKICPITGKKATEVHHKKSGADRQRYFLDVDTWMAVSRSGHRWIHDNPKEAKEKGYLL